MWAYGMLVNKGSLLVLKRPANKRTNPSCWNLPGGKREKGETVQEAVIREVKEETGLDATIIRCVGYYEDTHTTGDIMAIAVYLIQAEGDVIINEEHVAFAWMTPEKIANEQVIRYIRWVLEDTKEADIWKKKQ